MPELSARRRAELPDSAFAYVDSKGKRRLPINDEAHVRNALARFSHTRFESDAAREKARQRILRAARRHGIVPIGFFDSQLKMEIERRRRRGVALATPVEALPRGTVTLLLSDIEASTPLLARLGDRYAGVLEDVRALQRVAVADGGGYEIDARGDEFFAAFGEASAALRAAVRIQREIAERSWPDAATVRLRIGIHTGHPKVTDTGYVGLDVHAAARVCSAGNGGQIVVSDSGREAVGDDGVPDGLRVESLGRYRLHGLPDAVELFEVRAEALASESRPLRAERASP